MMITFINQYSLLIFGLILAIICCYFIFRYKSIYPVLVLVSVFILMIVSYFILNPKNGNAIVNKVEHDQGYLLEKPQFVEFFSPTCLACMISEPVVNGLQEDFGRKIDFVFINVGDEGSRGAIDEYGIKAVPTFIILDRKGKVVFRSSGVARTKVYRPKLEEVLASYIY